MDFGDVYTIDGIGFKSAGDSHWRHPDRVMISCWDDGIERFLLVDEVDLDFGTGYLQTIAHELAESCTTSKMTFNFFNLEPEWWNYSMQLN